MSNVSSNMCLAHLLECLWCVHNRLDCPHTVVSWWSTRMTSKSSPSPNSAVGTRASPFSHCWHSRYASDYGICLSWLCCVFWGRKWWAPMHPPSTHSTHSTRTQCLFSSDAPNARRHPGHGSCDESTMSQNTLCTLLLLTSIFILSLIFLFPNHFRSIFDCLFGQKINCAHHFHIYHYLFISLCALLIRLPQLYRCVAACCSAFGKLTLTHFFSSNFFISVCLLCRCDSFV